MTARQAKMIGSCTMTARQAKMIGSCTMTAHQAKMIGSRSVVCGGGGDEVTGPRSIS